MKFGIVTHNDVHNHGALLQMNAMVKILVGQLGINASVLQYNKNYDFIESGLRHKYEISIKSVNVYFKYIIERGFKLFLFNVKKKYIFEKFKKDEKLIGDFYSESSLLDGVIIGSDEVFALHTGLTPALFGYALPSNKVFSYAGSFGPTTINDINKLHCMEFVKGGLMSMIGLGMRDRNSMEISREITGREPVLNVDPVILYGYEKELASFSSSPLEKKYMIVYAYEKRMNEEEEYKPIIEYAHSKGYKVICPGFYHRWADKNVNVDPVELLHWFKYAQYVITDTFHGVVMSLITQKDFAVKIRDNANKIINLLDEYDLKDRIIGDDWNLLQIFSKRTDKEKINCEILKRKRESMNFLRKMIED